MESISAGVARVLIVEDDADLIRIYVRALCAAGFEVDTAGDGEEGLRRLLSRSYDVLVTDLCMPGMDGMGLLDSARRLRPNVPVVMMTAERDFEAYGSARDQGVVRYLLKPFKLGHLAQAVRTAAALHRAWERSSRK